MRTGCASKTSAFCLSQSETFADWLSQLGQLTVSFVNHSLDHHGEHSSVKVKVQLRGNGHACLGAENAHLNVIEVLLVANTYILFLPLAEVDLE